MSTPAFTFDQSDSEVLTICNTCKVWSSFAWTMEAAERSAAGHEERAHAGVNDFRERLRSRHAKRAATA